MINRLFFFCITVVSVLTFTDTAHAVSSSSLPTSLSLIAFNIQQSIKDIPGLITGAAYLLALVFGVAGVIKIKEHVENPQQHPIKLAMIRFGAGGALLALPTVLEAMELAIGGTTSSTTIFSITKLASDFMGLLKGSSALFSIFMPAGGMNSIMDNVVLSVVVVPGVITAVSYLLGLMLGFMAIIKLKEHVENPDQVKIQEGVVRLLIGGALFALPTIYEAMYLTITGQISGVLGGILGAIFGDGLFSGSSGATTCKIISALPGGDGIGKAVCTIISTSSKAPSFLSAISYLFGLILGVWALLKIRDHVLDPRSTPIWEGVSRFIAGGAFFALPFMVDTFASTILGQGGPTSLYISGKGFNEPTTASGCALGGLDAAVSCLMRDIMGPVYALVNFFGLVAGMIFIMIGISRLMRSAQEGAKGPGGIGTIMTFLTGGILVSLNGMMDAVSNSIFPSAAIKTFAELSYTDGLSDPEIGHVHTVISAVVRFMFVVGLISFARGWFIMRDVAEGNQQASAMAGVTHIVAGALAVNIGPLLNAVQTTLGVTGFGVTFS